MKVLGANSGRGQLGFFCLDQSDEFSFHLFLPSSSSGQESGPGGKTVPMESSRALG